MDKVLTIMQAGRNISELSTCLVVFYLLIQGQTYKFESSDGSKISMFELQIGRQVTLLRPGADHSYEHSKSRCVTIHR